MPNLWITTHWPYHEADDSPCRHVFFKTGKRKSLPAPGDTILFYESEWVVVNGKVVTHTFRCENGQRTPEAVPRGRSAIVGRATVAGLPRPITAADVVRDHGNLSEWSLIPCAEHRKVALLSKADLMELLGHPRATATRFLTLHKVKDKSVAERVLAALSG